MNKCYDGQYRKSDTRCVTHGQQLPPTDHLIKNTRKDIGATEQNEKKNTHIYKNSIDFFSQRYALFLQVIFDCHRLTSFGYFF